MDVSWTFNEITFEWDDSKADANLRKHGVTFEEAVDVFFDASALRGDAAVDEDDRDFVLGFSAKLKVLLVVHVESGDHVRIISARLATRTEEVTYVKSRSGL
jgi:uncharacterized DUF497 family protein